MKNRTIAQIKAEIKKVQKERKTIKEYSMFGTNNWKNLDREVELFQQYIDLEIDEDELEDMLKELEEEMSTDEFMECPEKRVLDFIQGY